MGSFLCIPKFKRDSKSYCLKDVEIQTDSFPIEEKEINLEYSFDEGLPIFVTLEYYTQRAKEELVNFWIKLHFGESLYDQYEKAVFPFSYIRISLEPELKSLSTLKAFRTELMLALQDTDQLDSDYSISNKLMEVYKRVFNKLPGAYIPPRISTTCAKFYAKVNESFIWCAPVINCCKIPVTYYGRVYMQHISWKEMEVFPRGLIYIIPDDFIEEYERNPFATIRSNLIQCAFMKQNGEIYNLEPIEEIAKRKGFRAVHFPPGNSNIRFINDENEIRHIANRTVKRIETDKFAFFYNDSSYYEDRGWKCPTFDKFENHFANRFRLRNKFDGSINRTIYGDAILILEE